jgi:hypothetical protein
MVKLTDFNILAIKLYQSDTYIKVIYLCCLIVFRRNATPISVSKTNHININV